MISESLGAEAQTEWLIMRVVDKALVELAKRGKGVKEGP
jgi:hypothetical protein